MSQDENQSLLKELARRKAQQLRRQVFKKAANVAKKVVSKLVKKLAIAIGKAIVSLLSAVGGPILIAALILIPIILIVVLLPGGDEDEIRDYRQAATYYDIPFKDFLAFGMAYTNNDLAKKDPNTLAYHFLKIKVTKYGYKDVCVKKDKKGKCIQKEKQKYVVSKNTVQGFKNISSLFGKYTKKAVMDYGSSGDYTFSVSVLSLDQAMKDAKFSKAKIEYAKNILESDSLSDYDSVGSGGLADDIGDFIAGLCIGNLKPGGKVADNATSTVKRYEPLIRKYAVKYGVDDYVGFIQAIMMAESNGNGNDPMQASESGFADKVEPGCISKKGGNRIGCIKNPEDSIHAGVLTFKNRLKKANGNLLVTAQAYNYGEYFAEWIIKHGGEYTLELSKLYQNTVMKKAGQGLGTANHAIKVAGFYKNTGTCENKGAMAAAVGAKWIGHSSYEMGWGRNDADVARGRFDCSAFVYWAYQQVGINLGNRSSVTTDTLKVKGKRVPVSEMKPGDMLFFNTYKTDGHVVIYVGGDKAIGSQSSKGVAYIDINNSYWGPRFAGKVIRVIN